MASAKLSLLAAVALLGLSGCGAKTDLSSGDASVIEPFFTFPCRWSLGRRLRVASSLDGFSELAGAIHPSQDVALVFGLGPQSLGAEITLTDPPRVLVNHERGRVGELVGSAGGFVELVDEGGECRVSTLDASLSAERAFVAPPGCSVSQRQAQVLDVASASSDGVSLIAIDLDDAARPLYRDPEFATQAWGTFDGDRGGVVLRDNGGRLRADHLHLDGTTTRHDLGALEAPFSAAPDRLLHGAVLLWSVDGRARVDRVRFDAPGELEGVASAAQLAGLGSSLRPELVTNETEALLALEDGRLVAVPLNGSSELREPGRVDARGEVGAMRILLRPNSSTGGVLFTERSSDGSAPSLFFQTLTCNR